MLIYTDSSVIGGCEDPEFARDSQTVWQYFIKGRHHLVISQLTLEELKGVPQKVRDRLKQVPKEHQIVLPNSPQALELAQMYLKRGILGGGSFADALHVAFATIGRVDLVLSWNFKHIVNVRRIRLFQAVNLEQGYGIIDIRSPKEVLEDV